jgi:cell division cycle 2-like protein
MPARKRPAAVLDAGHGETTQESASCSKRIHTSMGSTEEYEDFSPIGMGSFGVVLKARHRATGKTVAIKALSSTDETEEAPDVAEAELLSEARLLEACSGNPYVVGFEGLVRDSVTGDTCLAMEYIAASSLETFLWDRRRGPPLTESTVRTLMWKLLTGAKLMHERHVVHRDIKPANILVGEDGDLVKICDLGLAISMSELPPYTQAGSASYMAPEMLLEKPDYDTLVDTWSLGCVMAEMLTGKTLFLGEDDEEIEFDDEIGQLCSIFRVLGMPDKRTWPGFTSLPLTAKALPLLPAARHKHSSLRDIIPEEKLSKEGFQVLQGLLTCNPNKRLTAAKALKLPWFSAPRPASAAKVDAFVELPRKKPPRIKFILRAIPEPKPEKITFKIPLAVWNAQRV